MRKSPGTATDTIAYTYDSTWKDQLAAYDGTDIDYDEIGNPWGYTNDRYFMWQGRELRFFDTDDGYVEYRYNENGLRCRKTFTDYVTELDDVYDYYWTDDCRLLGYTVTMAGSTEPYSVLVLYNSAQEPIGFTVGEHTYYYIKNIQGDVLTVTDAEGTPIINYTYDAWGAMTVSPATQNVSNTILARVAFLNPVTYRGYFYDYELGLYYLQSRYYDPETGRFVNEDDFTCCSVENHLTAANLFAYSINNPIGFRDQTGNGVISKEMAANHLAYNKSIELEDGYINGQAVGNVAEMKYGIWRIASNGCELIAIYNVLYAMGKKRDLANIIYDFEINGGIWMEGMFGTKPSAVGKYLKGKKLALTTYYATKKIDANTTKGDICVIIYFHTGVMIHTVMTKKNSEDSIDVYNRYSNSSSVRSAESVYDLVKTDGYKMRIGWIVKK